MKTEFWILVKIGMETVIWHFGNSVFVRRNYPNVAYQSYDSDGDGRYDMIISPSEEGEIELSEIGALRDAQDIGI